MKRHFILKKILPLILLAALMAALGRLNAAEAATPYKTYTVDGYGSITRTQTAYLPYETITKIGEESLLAPADFSMLEDGSMYILDSGNKRVVAADPQHQPTLIFGEGILVNPRGIFVTEDRTCYVADRDAGSIFVFNAQGELVSTYGKPAAAMYGESQDFKPLKIVVNSSGIMYVICETNTNGIVEISPVGGGTFLGYFGTNAADDSILRIIWRAILTDKQRAKMVGNIPATPDNMAIDDKGLIYTVTRGEDEGSVKWLNIAGINMLEPDAYDAVPAAIAGGNHDNCYVVSQEGYIYEYSNEGDLLFAFAGSDDGGQRIGLNTKIEAIQVGSDDKLYVLDSDKAQIQIYEPTEFTNYLHEALYLFSKGRYGESKKPLSEVLEMNNLFDYANMAMGKAYYKEEDYETARFYAKLANDTETYSDAYWEIRNAWLKHNLTTIVFIAAGIAVLVLLIKWLDKKREILDGPRRALKKLGEKKLIRELRFMFYFMRHPIEGCYSLKHYSSVSVGSASILLGVVMVFYVINKYFCGFLTKTVREGEYTVLTDIGLIAAIMILVVSCNYLMCTINDGEARVKDIYCSLVYSLAPYIVFTPFIFLISQAVTENEIFFVSFGRLVMIAWAAVLLFISAKEINDYTFGETVKVLLLTLFTILIVCLLLFIIYVLWSQVFDFLQQLPREVVYRIGS